MADFTKPDGTPFSDAELDAIIAGGQQPGHGLEAIKARGAKAIASIPPATAEEIEPSALKRGLAGLGGAMLEPVMGAAEKFELMFPGEGAAGQERVRQIGAERTARRGALSQLKETPAGQLGAFAGEVLPYVAASPTIPAQMGVGVGLGFLRGGPDRPTGIGQELATSALSGATEGATTGAMMKGAQWLGTGINAARGKYSNDGQKLMDIDAAAQRLGLTGDIAPSVRQLALNVPESAEQVGRQADKLRGTLSTTRQVPGATGGVATQTIPGGVLREELVDAVKTRYTQATQKYQAVDQLAQQTGAGNISPIYSVPQLVRLQKNAVKGDEASQLAASMINDYDQYALSWIGQPLAQGASQQQIKAAGIPVTTYHETRVAVGKALNNLQRTNPANKTSAQVRAQELLTDLKNGLDNEAEQWAKRNSTNRDVMDAYNDAREFYAKVVAPAVIENPLARKATTRRAPWTTAEEMYTAVSNPRNEELVARLEPTLGAAGTDALTTLRGLPDVGHAMATRRAPNAPMRGGLEMANVLAALRGHPTAALTSFAPGLGWAGRTGTAKRLYAAEDPLNRAVSGAVQYPQENLDRRTRTLLGQR